MPAGPEVPCTSFSVCFAGREPREGGLTQSTGPAVGCRRLLPLQAAGKEAVGFTAGVFGLGKKKEKDFFFFFKNTLAM